MAGVRGEPRFDRLLTAHSDLPPENGSGANHYPMAAETLTALGSPHEIPDEWIKGAEFYRADLSRVEPISTVDAALGRRDRHGDWLDHFRRELDRLPWQQVVAEWSGVLAPGLSGAMFHGLIRTAHAVRAMRHGPGAARRGELAAGLAYWASCYTPLPGLAQPVRLSQDDLLTELEHPWLADRRDVEFHAAMARLTSRPLAPVVDVNALSARPSDELQFVVRAAALGFLEMLVQERHRIWLLHGVTGPAAAGLLLPDLRPPAAQALVAHAQQAVVALFAAYGAPFAAGAHLRKTAPPWSELVRLAIARRSVHGLKLIDALQRFDDGRDELFRSTAVQWFEWV